MRVLQGLLFCTVLPFFSSIAQQPLPQPEYRDALVLIDKWVEAQRDFDRIPGVSVAIVEDQDILWSKGYGYANPEKKTPMTPETLFSICSVSKLFTSIAIMQLVEQGKLRLDDSIQAVLPHYNLRQKFPDSGPITIRAILSHSSGLPRESDYPYWSKPDFRFPTDDEIKTKLGSQETWYPANTYFQYSNLGITLLGEVVAHISGVSYEQYVKDHILAPLRLADTRPALPKDLWGTRMAIGYGSTHRDGHRDKMPFFQTNGIAPAAGFSSSVEDLARFASWQFRLLSNGGKEILKASTLQDMHRVQFLDPNWRTAYGLGFSVREYNGVSLVGHGGSCPGYLTSLVMDTRKQLGIVVMFNGQGESLRKYTDAIYNILTAIKKDSADAGASSLDSYTGNYDDYQFGSEILVFKWQGKLATVKISSDDPVNSMSRLKHVGGDLFRRIRADGTEGNDVFFQKNADGTIRGLIESSNFYGRL